MVEVDKTDVVISGVRVETARPLGCPVHPTPILFVHGGMHGSWTWRKFQDHFAQRGYETHALNWFNRNGSRPLDEKAFVRRGLADMAEEVSLVTATLPTAPIVIAHSMGGMVAQKYAEAYGDVKAMALLSPVAAAAAGAPPKDFSVDLDKPWGPPPYPMARKVFLPDLDEDEAREVYGLFCPESPRCVYEATQSQPSVDAARVTCPMLIVGAEHDAVVPAAVSERLSRFYACAFVLAEGRGHDLPYEPRWAETAEVVHRWLQRVDPTE